MKGGCSHYWIDRQSHSNTIKSMHEKLPVFLGKRCLNHFTSHRIPSKTAQILLGHPLSHLIQGRDRPSQSEAIGRGGFVARHRGPQPIPCRDAGHKLLLCVRFEPRNGEVSMGSDQPKKGGKKAILFFIFFEWT